LLGAAGLVPSLQTETLAARVNRVPLKLY
jgi:hypothetical protein